MKPNRWRVVVDFLMVFWPILLMPMIVLTALHFRQPWFGMIAFAGIGLMIRFWWSCIFGLLNASAIIAGFLVCAIATLKVLMR